jgi:hypothetical protein
VGEEQDLFFGKKLLKCDINFFEGILGDKLLTLFQKMKMLIATKCRDGVALCG